jgi:hypothetical protein
VLGCATAQALRTRVSHGGADWPCSADPRSSQLSFDVWDIATWAVMSQEARGLDPKDWVVPPDETRIDGQAHWWLFKPIKPASYRRFDDWSEKLSAELAALLVLPAARVELAHGDTDEGIISKNVTPNGWSMESGDTLLSEYEGYVSCALDDRPSNRIGHNLDNIAQVLEGCIGPPDSACEARTGIDVFAGYLVFDAWIANTDRHAINWGVLTCEEDGRQALAASFDHGSALASGTQDARLESTTPEHYAARGFAGRFEDGARLPLVDLARTAVGLAGSPAADWLERLALVTQSQVEEIVAGIPGMSVVRRTFLCNLLETNQRRLTS